MFWDLLRSLLWTDPLICASTALMGSISMLASIWDGTGRLQHRIARRWARMMLAICGAKVTVSGIENLTPGATYVFCSNHLSLIDTPLVFGHLPWDFRILAKRSLFSIPFLGWHLRRTGHLPVDPDDIRTAARNIILAARRVAEGISIVIFPEGGRSPDGRMGEFKAGATYIAIRAGVPVVPMCILGTGEVHRTGSVIVRPGPVELRIGTPIPTAGRSAAQAESLLSEVRDRIKSLMEASLQPHPCTARGPG